MMKKMILLVALAAMSTGVFAQNFDYGIKGGLNFSNITDSDWDMKAGFHLGAFAEFKISDYFGIQPEFVYSRQGAFVKEDGWKYWARFNYINIPVLAKIYIAERLSVNVGPQFGLLLNSKMKAKNGGDSGKTDIDGTKSFDVSFGMGLSYNLDYNWFIDARYNLGLTDMSKNGDGKNSVIQVGVGYRF